MGRPELRIPAAGPAAASSGQTAAGLPDGKPLQAYRRSVSDAGSSAVAVALDPKRAVRWLRKGRRMKGTDGTWQRASDEAMSSAAEPLRERCLRWRMPRTCRDLSGSAAAAPRAADCCCRRSASLSKIWLDARFTLSSCAYDAWHGDNVSKGAVPTGDARVCV